ncbi:MAG: nitronate monooxygenase [Dehalococcoidia bacterium]|nr:nitronate monooxygenase [Dehalococcoidia bacterium]
MTGWHDRVTSILGSEYPVLLGPMRLVTLGELAAAVSNCGGFGQIAASGLEGEQLRNEIVRARELTQRPIGVNIPIYRPNAVQALEIAIEMGIEAITTSAGNPAPLMARVREAGLKVLHKVSTVEMARKAEAAGVDAVIATGFEAGGHVGREQITTMCLVPQLVSSVNIPVVAAGGIADARGIVAAFALGAEGVEMGTRFLATWECPVPFFYKERVRDAMCNETLLLGKEAMPIRVLKNEVTARVAGMHQAEADRTITSQGDAGYVQSGGDRETAVMPCGQSAGMVKEILSVQEVFADLTGGVDAVLERLAKLFGGGQR